MENKVLVLFAHPSQSRSEVNRPLFNVAKNMDGVTAVDLYGEYPTYNINIAKEQQRLIDHDVVIFQFPLFWYSTPAILKEWQDLILEYGFAYGHDGKALHGKKFLCAISAGGPKSAYRPEGSNNYPIEDLLRPLENMASLTGMTYLAPFALFGARTAVEDNKLSHHIESYEEVLKRLVQDPSAFDDVEITSNLATYIDQLPEEL
ncbi:NAD(P)H-dependent oxidoreductase [Vibrio maerlii]|uniref:NAD(P)H-dependent oxidoreductase n=1 Tax=Vibrio maerlii TaxID=2231648 RepID=UPI000E3C6F9E|nr:NAD(P)H-dependent oxidoreductase [Vibrio maerlii]